MTVSLSLSDMEEDGESKCSVLVAMMQEHRRSNKQQAVKELQIGFVVYKVSLWIGW